MFYIHIKNLEEYNPGYKDRELIWCKVYFKMINADPEFEMLCETDKWRFVAFVMLEIQTKRPVPLNEEWLSRKGFDFNSRKLSDTVASIIKSIEIYDDLMKVVENNSVTEKKEACNILLQTFEKSVLRVEKNRVEEIESVPIIVTDSILPAQAPSGAKTGPVKLKHLTYVLLTTEEHTKLISRFGTDQVEQYIFRLNNYIGSTGRKYKSHYHTILMWADRDTSKAGS